MCCLSNEQLGFSYMPHCATRDPCDLAERLGTVLHMHAEPSMRYCTCSTNQKSPCQAVELLRDVSSVEPVTYEQQQQADAAGVRSVALFIAELSDRSSPVALMGTAQLFGNASTGCPGACALTSPTAVHGPADYKTG